MRPVTVSSCRCPLPWNYTTRMPCLPQQSDQRYLRNHVYARNIAASATPRDEYVVVGGIPRNLPVVSRLAKTLNETYSVRPSFPSPAVATFRCKNGEVTIGNVLELTCILFSPPFTDFLKQARTGVVGTKKAAGGTYYPPGQSKGVASATHTNQCASATSNLDFDKHWLVNTVSSVGIGI